MIIWLASYPKCGNTWVRTFITSLLYTKDGISNFDLLNKIDQYPIKKYFEGLLKNYQDIEEIKKKWIISQDKINLENKIKIFKTHHINCKIESFPFTNLDNTLGVIYISRDPRNVISSLKYHYSLSSYEEAKKFLFDENRWLGGTNINSKNEIISKDSKAYRFPTLISSWKTHFNSWKIVKKNFLLIKYENLIENPYKEFTKIKNYLGQLLNITFDNNKFNNAIITSSFDNLKKMENKGHFKEQIAEKHTKIKKKFFNLGPYNNWKELLNKNMSNEIEKKFNIEMKELKYL